MNYSNILLLLFIIFSVSGESKYNSKRGDSLYKEYMSEIDTTNKNDSQRIKYFIRINDIEYVDGIKWVKDYKFINSKFYIIPTIGKPFWVDNIQVIEDTIKKCNVDFNIWDRILNN